MIVGDLDTGLDFTHPDLAPNYDAANSADCSSGVATPLLPGNDHNGHGTHTAGTIAAAVNGIGITGVAPERQHRRHQGRATTTGSSSRRWSSVHTCRVASHGIDVTNNSYFADPWLFNCANDPEQRVIWAAERRAIRHAQSKGTVVVVSEGNTSDDLSHPTQDITSPDNTTPVTRAITNACSVIPVEVPGAVGVTATGDLSLKSYYSSYGISTADVAAPGGDRRFQITADWAGGPRSRPAHTPRARRAEGRRPGRHVLLPARHVDAPARTSQVSRRLIISHTGMKGRAVAAALQQATNPLPCPTRAAPSTPTSRLSATVPRRPAPAASATTASTAAAKSTP